MGAGGSNRTLRGSDLHKKNESETNVNSSDERIACLHIFSMFFRFDFALLVLAVDIFPAELDGGYLPLVNIFVQEVLDADCAKKLPFREYWKCIPSAEPPASLDVLCCATYICLSYF